MADRKRILIVDDERDLVGVLARRLAATGAYEVTAAFDGEEGLHKARVVRPDAVLVDLAMPEMDGWELCRRLRVDPGTRGIPVAVMTAWWTDGLQKRARAEGITRLLLKPFEDGRLLELLGEMSAARDAARGEGGDAS